jgi:hypothetical protein
MTTEKSISGTDTSRDDVPVIVKVFATDEGTDIHAFNRQRQNIGLTISDEDAPDTTTNVTLLFGDARKLGNALVALADEAEEWQNQKPERNNW